MFAASLKRGIRQLWSRKMYLFMMLLVPIGVTFFFLNLMDKGLPLKVPAGMVDLDHSSMSRTITRNLGATELVDIVSDYESYSKALDKVKAGEIYGFFLIPENFQEDALSGRNPSLAFYSDLSVFIPGSLAFKGFKTIAVSTKGGIVMTSLVSAGISDAAAGSLIQPVVVQDHPIGNPWTNYSIYLCNSFLPCLLALVIMLMTVFSVCHEMKTGTSVEWLAAANGNIAVAVAGKLLPQTLIFTAVGVAMQAVFYGFLHFPLLNHPLHIILAMVLLVIGCQSFALFICELLPNLRLAASICSLVGILSFSIGAFSYPVPSMYGAVGIFSYLIPIRYYFLIYIDQALNGIPIYYSRYYYVALLIFPLVAMTGLRRLKKHALNPVYVP